MPTKKKATKTSKIKKDKLEKDIDNLEDNLENIEKIKELEENIIRKKEEIREDLRNQLISQNKFGKQFDDMVEDYLYFVELKERLQYDLGINGIRYKSTGGNGFTTYKPNESYERLLKTNGQMLTILEKLDLKAPDDGESGDEDDLL